MKLLLSLFVLLLSLHLHAANRVVTIQDHQLVVDGIKQPMLFGAELQYFRLRGGYGPNVPREKVLDHWGKALDRMVEAKMNAISFYIPWDFHEYAEGKFDFHGTVDQDNDGNADYPSRDLHTFFKMIDERGIKRIMVRPGPYINAEWGFLGFGAIPQWFHEKYPDSHMQTSWGWKTKLYDYHNPDLLRHTQIWFETLLKQVLADKMGAGKPIMFMQIDNETNFQWQSIYNHDYGPRAIGRYQDFLKTRYGNIAALNSAHGKTWANWTAVKAPTIFGKNRAEDQDWYRFQDYSIFDYLRKIRGIWETLGVKEPEILFTLAESYNAPNNGMLPNYRYRNMPGETGMMTVNLYPKTFETPDKTLHNQPFKSDLDVLAADEASDMYLKSKQEWVFGPEIQGGWWKGIDVSDESRQQTYLTTSGRGMKALFIYYFNEGYNWGVEWARGQVLPVYEELRKEMGFARIDAHLLSNQFWGELQARVDQKLLIGFNARDLVQFGSWGQEHKLYFDAPLGADAEKKEHYDVVKKMGEKLFGPHADFLARSTNVFDSVALVKDSEMHATSFEPRLDNILTSADWAAGLVGLLSNEGLQPRVLHGDINQPADFDTSKILFHIDSDVNAAGTIAALRRALAQGQTVVNFLGDNAARQLAESSRLSASYHGDNKRQTLTYFLDAQGRLAPKGTPGTKSVGLVVASPMFTYDLGNRAHGCQGILYQNDKVVGYRCGNLIQIGSLFFDGYNMSHYHEIDTQNHRAFLRALLAEQSVTPSIGVSLEAKKVAAFARRDANMTWLTVKTSHRNAQEFKLKIQAALLPGTAAKYEVRDLLNETVQILTAKELTETGFTSYLKSEDSTVFTIKKSAR